MSGWNDSTRRHDDPRRGRSAGWDRAAANAPEHLIVPTQESIVHAHRRRRALERLDGLTTGIVVAGVAGTAGFAILAAATWSGVPGARSATDLPAVVGSERGSGGSSGGPGSSGSGGVSPTADPFGGALDPNNTGSGGSSGGQGSGRVRPVQPGTGRNHATTGGSG